jgi:hypothetical protein
MKETTDSAFVVSIHYDRPKGSARIILKWKGRHEISDFDFDHLGDVIDWGSQTENEGWAIVQFSPDLHVPTLPPESQSAPVILQTHDPLCVGDSIHLRPSSKGRKDSGTAGF